MGFVVGGKLMSVALDTEREVAGLEPSLPSLRPAPGDRHSIRRIEPRSVLRFSALFSMTLGLLVLVLGGFLYLTLSAVGVVGRVQTFIQNAGWPSFHFQSATVFGMLLLLTVVGAAAFTGLCVLAAAVHNIVSASGRGIQVTLHE